MLTLSPTAARQSANMSRQAVADEIGVTRQTVWRWEQPEGSHSPTAAQLALIKKLYSLDGLHLGALVAWYGARS